MNPESEKYIQFGQVALRGPAGEVLPAVMLYIKATPETTEAETEMIQDIGKVFADKFRQIRRLEKEAEKRMKK
ncbi:MAG: hypothetical protein AB9907_14850 [Flexilinea sp.]